MVLKFVILLMLVTPVAAFAQTEELTPPPLVTGTPPPPPAPEPGGLLVQPGTPPPPGMMPPPGYVPGHQPNTGYPYSPYGSPLATGDQKPPLEVGLMVSESLFGMLTSAVIALLPYYLLLRPMVIGNGAISNDSTVNTAIFVLVYASLPLAVSQTQISLANGSRYYESDTWPAALAGLAAEAAVLTLKR